MTALEFLGTPEMQEFMLILMQVSAFAGMVGAIVYEVIGAVWRAVSRRFNPEPSIDDWHRQAHANDDMREPDSWIDPPETRAGFADLDDDELYQTSARRFADLIPRGAL